MAIFPKGSDGTDVNACHRSNAKDLLVTADDYGFVRLYNYPAVVCTRAPRGH